MILSKRNHEGVRAALWALRMYRVSGMSAGRLRQSAGRRAVQEKPGCAVAACSSQPLAVGSSLASINIPLGLIKRASVSIIAGLRMRRAAWRRFGQGSGNIT